MSFRHVNSNDAFIGNSLPWDIIDEEGKLLLRKGNVILTESQVNTILARGLYYVDDYLEQSKPRFGEQLAEVSPFDLIDEVHSKLRLYMNNLEKEPDLPAKIFELCRMIHAACLKDADATLSTILIGPKEQYSIAHQVHAAIICQIISQSMNISSEERMSLLAAALTQNIGMLKLQEVLYRQEEPLSYEQFQLVRIHPESGAEILRLYGVTDERWIDGVRQHHEALDGKGYPNGLEGDGIGRIARLISISDFFCAKVSGRSYRTPMSTFEAMQFVFDRKDSRVDTDIAELFVKVLGIYLPGTLVRLSNKETAVVIRRGEKAHNPVTYSIMGQNDKLFLLPFERDCTKTEYRIEEVIAPGKYDSKVNRYLLWGYSKLNRMS